MAYFSCRFAFQQICLIELGCLRYSINLRY
ncbi:DUF3709 domain-containing protein [Waltera sp.]